MAIRKKVILFIFGLGLVFIFLFLWLNHLTISRSESEQKDLFAAKVASRLFHAIQSEENRIATLCLDWATWDAMHGYVEKPSRDFEMDSLPPGVAAEADLSLILILDRKMEVVFHQGFNQQTQRAVQFKLHGSDAFPLWECIKRRFAHPEKQSMISSTEFGPLLAISAPILHSDGQGPMNGRVVMGRLVDPSFQDRIGASIQEKTRLLLPEQLSAELAGQGPDPFAHADFFQKEGRDGLLIYGRMRDAAGRPAFAFRVEADKALFSLQEKAVRNFLIALILSTLLAGTLYFFFLERVLLRRLKSISQRTKHIISLQDLSLRVQEDRDDEISRLGRDINKMLERLQNENTRQREMENRLMMNEKLVATGRLAAHIAHEINNPLFAISNSIAVIKRRTQNASGDVGEVMALAEKEIRRVRKITRKLLDSGKIDLEKFKECDIAAILDNACDVLKLSRQTRNTVITRRESSGELPIFCNPDGLQQVFMNLILNASEAMKGRGEIVIEVERKEEAYEIHFKDAGPGFPADVKRRIFEPFNSSKEAKGAGLGLYISYSIVKRNGGSLVLEEAYGPGSHLIVTLPRRGEVDPA